jgi:hypothetical protein
MDCNTAQASILEQGADLSEAVREHLAGCHSCREFARLQQLLLDQEPGAGPAPALDRAVLDTAHRRLRRGWQFLASWRPAYRAAAAAVLAAGALYVLQQPRPQAPLSSDPLAAAVRHWAGAQVDLEVIEGGLDAAVAELGSMDPPAAGQEPALDADRAESWDGLMELEFDLYFASEYLQQAGG